VETPRRLTTFFGNRNQEVFMRTTLLVSAAVLGLAAAPAFAQGMDPVTGARPGNIPGTNNSLPLGNTASNIGPSDTASPIAPHLPTPSVGDDGSPRQYLMAARQALSAHRTGEAQQALEMAETRALDRSTAPAAASMPDQNPMVRQISLALDALSRRDWAGADRIIDRAMQMAGRGAAVPGPTTM